MESSILARRYLAATVRSADPEKYYFGSRLETGEVVLLEITVPSPNMIGGYQIVAKSSSAALIKPFIHSVVYLLK
jgi:hypothetical protein